jgi:hypothetical protein
MTPAPWKEIRVAIAPPADDETFSSVVDRAATFWGMERTGLMGSWMLNEASEAQAAEADAPTPDLLSVLAKTIGLEEETMRRTVVDHDETLVAAAHRVAYCPLCWVEDSEEGRGPYFRRSWCSLAAIGCERHGVPLYPWRRNSRGDRSPPPTQQSTGLHKETWRQSVNHALQWRDASDNQPLRNLLSDISTFSMQVVETLRGGEFPRNWRGDSHALRDLIVLLTTNPAPFSERIPLDRLVPDVSDERMFGGLRRVAAPATSLDGWKAAGQLGSPQVRRTLWWLVARTIEPRWKPMPIRGLPGICYDSQSWWRRRIEASVSGHAQLQLRRVASRLGLLFPEQVADLFVA